MKALKEFVAGTAVLLAFGVLRMLPPRHALRLLGYLFGLFGPWMKITSRMRRTLLIAFPQLSDAEREARVRKVWQTFGRTVATIPHLANFSAGRRGAQVTARNFENYQQLEGKPAIIIGAHVGNWEVASAMPKTHTRNVTVSYKPAHNPYVEKIIQAYRGATGTQFVRKENIPRVSAQTLRSGQVMYFTIDQRVFPGDEISFLGVPAMSSRFPARLAVKFNCPILPVEAVWVKDAHYESVFHEPLYPDLSIADEDARAHELMNRMFGQIEAMILRRPDEWFCLKARWSEAESAVILKDRAAAEARAAKLRA
jgi:KDO2-lipid IV(A) lauroyltransferase